MTEKEVIGIIETGKRCVFRATSNECDRDCGFCHLALEDRDIIDAYEMAITALEEIEQYRAIGTVEECRDAVDKIKDAPTIEAVPVVHGEWIEVHDHMWRRNSEGEIDIFAWFGGCHNGAYCELCGDRPCVHCEPDFEKTYCSEISYKCSVCGEHVKNKSNFCPNCGANMKGEQYELAEDR